MVYLGFWGLFSAVDEYTSGALVGVWGLYELQRDGGDEGDGGDGGDDEGVCSPGIAVGHLYYFLVVVFPNQPGGRKLLTTPALL